MKNNALIFLAVLFWTTTNAMADSLFFKHIHPSQVYSVYAASTDTSFTILLDGGTLRLVGVFNKDVSFPNGHGTRFDHVDIADNIAHGSKILFVNCALTPGPDGDPEQEFFELPFTQFDNLQLEFENCWLYGNGTGIRINSGHRGQVIARDTWFTMADTAIVSDEFVNSTIFEDCRFAWGKAGVVYNDGTLQINNCDFVSMDLGISLFGTASLSAEKCLFQSDRTMMSFSDSAFVVMDSCAFYSVENFCMEGLTDTSAMQLTITNSYFDPSSIPENNRIHNLPTAILTQSSDQQARSNNDLATDIEIHIDDSEPLYADGPLGLSIILPAFSDDNQPLESRMIKVYNLEEDMLSPQNISLFRTSSEFRQNHRAGEVALDSSIIVDLPVERSQTVRLDSVLTIENRGLLLITIDDGF
jgi:hypothetical protein